MAVFHIASPAEFAAHPLKKIMPLHNYVKGKCFNLYQSLQQWSVIKRMVTSKAHMHFSQYIKDKPTKWGYKYWVLDDPLGYTIDFNVTVVPGIREQFQRMG